jgi:hypothetical protein
MENLARRDRIRTALECKKPNEEGMKGTAKRMATVLDPNAMTDLNLGPGRVCEAGCCSDCCSRVLFPTFATEVETDVERFPDLEQFTFNEVHWSDSGTTLNFVRLLERIRRSIAAEYELPLSSIIPVQAYSRRYTAGAQQTGGGGAVGDSIILHTDEGTHACYHYSSVLYLNTQGVDFEGGNFVWNDLKPKEEGEDPGKSEERVRTPLHPSRGAAVIFSSGWENMHEVEPLTSGHRYSVPCFFTTEAVPSFQMDAIGGVPDGGEAIADELEYLLFTREVRTAVEAPRYVKELMMKWHHLFAPSHA